VIYNLPVQCRTIPMKRIQIRYLCPVICCLVLLVWQILPASGGDDQTALRKVFEKALDTTNIKAQGMPGFQLLGDIRIRVKKDLTAQGKYLLTWTPEGKWKEDIEFEDYRRTRVGDGQQFWQVRSTNIENPPIYELDELLRVGRHLRIPEGDTLKRVHPEKIDGTAADCILDVLNKWTSTMFCFSSASGELLRYLPGTESSQLPWKVRGEEYSQFQSWSGKRFPTRLTGFNGKQPVVELQLEGIKPLPEFPSDFFNPPLDASVWRDCRENAPWTLKDKVPPTYPQSARINRVQGTVVLYATIQENGHASGFHIVHSAGTELDYAAINAISRWRWKPTKGCENSKGRTELLTDVTFSLQLY
jgi:TonB family protein